MNPTGAEYFCGIHILRGEEYGHQCRGPVARGGLSVKAIVLVYIARSPIDLDVFPIVLDEAGLTALEVVLKKSIGWRCIWKRIQIGMGKQILCHRIQNRQTRVADVRGEIVLRIIQLDALGQKGREITVSHGLSQNTGGGFSALVPASPFVVSKEEQLVLQGGPADRSAKDALRIDVLGNDRILVIVAPRIGVEIMVLQQTVGGAMDVVGTGLQNCDNGAAIRVSVSCGRVGRDYAYFGNGIRRGIISNQIVLRLVQVGAFQRVVIGLSAIAVDLRNVVVVGIALDGVVSRHARRVRVDGSRLEKGERGEVPAVQRDASDLIGRESVSQ